MHKVEMYAITTSDIYNFTIGFFDNQSQPYTKTNLYTALEKLEASNQQVCAIISGYHRVKPDSSVSNYAYIPILYLQSPNQSDIRIRHTTYAYEKSDGTVKVAGNYNTYPDYDVIS